MRIEICQSYEALSLKAKEIVTSELGQHKALTLCAATGGSPTRMYELLVEEASRQPELFSQFTVLKLDEWGGIPMDHPGTCESYLRNYFVGPLQIPEDRYIAFQSDPENPKAECERLQQILDQKGPIDICILGIGMNGHIALNEPAPSLHTNCHVAHLSQKSLQHPMIAGDTEKPGYGLTLGMANIFQSRLIILLINGIKKREITQAFLEQKISTELPASLLWLHPNVICLIDREAAHSSNWGGIPMDHPGTCESYLRNYFVGPLQIPEDRYIAFQSDPENPKAECERLQQILDQKGPIDICILGIGMNGHIALNEPAPSLHTNCHVAHLSQKSLQHPMIAGDTEKPGYGLTLGMANIFQSRLIILLINGIKKREITQAFLEQKISTELPASLLWLHPNVICLIDREAAHSSN